eukprot:CAMPEP_0115552976 /NCGR_PEP_ID=MMETSP0271-20121206/96526_1 /TAXON_ID=71861 /ORGANISM="Scrippsiella trochoidea, Strain CCMP3099" /LENGTH=174 /DNA_ID=CAMNT_0002986629 /DNA_START=198 /DNA_END=722 /DNA_ORIENTATION=+
MKLVKENFSSQRRGARANNFAMGSTSQASPTTNKLRSGRSIPRETRGSIETCGQGNFPSGGNVKKNTPKTKTQIVVPNRAVSGNSCMGLMVNLLSVDFLSFTIQFFRNQIANAWPITKFGQYETVSHGVTSSNSNTQSKTAIGTDSTTPIVNNVQSSEFVQLLIAICNGVNKNK